MLVFTMPSKTRPTKRLNVNINKQVGWIPECIFANDFEWPDELNDTNLQISDKKRFVGTMLQVVYDSATTFESTVLAYVKPRPPKTPASATPAGVPPSTGPSSDELNLIYKARDEIKIKPAGWAWQELKDKTDWRAQIEKYSPYALCMCFDNPDEMDKFNFFDMSQRNLVLQPNVDMLSYTIKGKRNPQYPYQKEMTKAPDVLNAEPTDQQSLYLELAEFHNKMTLPMLTISQISEQNVRAEMKEMMKSVDKVLENFVPPEVEKFYTNLLPHILQNVRPPASTVYTLMTFYLGGDNYSAADPALESTYAYSNLQIQRDFPAIIARATANRYAVINTDLSKIGLLNHIKLKDKNTTHDNFAKYDKSRALDRVNEYNKD